jgi:ribonucleotide monophosphatase NagD (HAD superfamily)
MSKSKIVCLDFDGICVMHEYPKIGADVPNAVKVLKKLNENQVKIILCIVRSGEFLQDSVN